MSYKLFNDFMAKIIEAEDYDELAAYGLEISNHFTPKTVLAYTQKYWSDNQPKPIIYQLFTFTTDEKKKDRTRQEEYIKSILKRKENLQLVELWYCVEHEDTNLHFHVGLGSHKSIPPDAFKQYKALYGHVHKTPKETKNSDGCSDYTSKEIGSIRLL